MKEVTKIKDHYGQDVIYVQKCSKYKQENQEIEKKPISCLHNSENAKIHDILNAIENYYSN